jgi:hypothetical protein
MNISVQAINEFQKTHVLDIYTQTMMIQKTARNFDQAYFYPFDIFYMGTNFVAINPNTTNASSLPILAIGFSGYTNNFVPSVENMQTTTMVNGTVVQSQYAGLTLTRTIISIVFVMFILLVSWALTILVVIITIVALFSKRFPITDGIVVLPITVILTIASLRALFVDSPPFGELH